MWALPWQRDDGAWMIPLDIESENGSSRGSTWVPLERDHPQYQEWSDYIRARMSANWAQGISDRLPS